MRLAIPLAIVALAAALLSGCGSSSNEGGSTTGSSTQSPPAKTSTAPIGASAKSCDTYAVDAEALRAAGLSCKEARQVMYGWQRQPACAKPTGASRTSCSTRSYRCLGARTDRGLAVSCARAGESVAFIVKKPR
ncbi:MAG TPA: hypothetical protein VHU86_03060 [Solirubrobacterales bacterium]|jgi:hypothetical protein|nr:hypothetical protein [Solirubrobacterales bacterium]